jgi:SAM-dependent methyltransferase
MPAAERAHPEHPGFKPGKKAYKRFINRYKQAEPYVIGRDVLDVPCGVGWGTSLLAPLCNVFGLDIEKEAVVYARLHYPGPSFHVGDMTDMPFDSETFNTVVCFEGYEHVDRNSQKLLISEIRRVLRPGGVLVMTVPLDGYSKGKNPFHLHEPTLREITEDLSGFKDIDNRQIGSVLWYVGEVK